MSVATHIARSARTRAASLLRTIQFDHPPNCPCHSNPSHPHHAQHASSLLRNLATPSSPQTDYAFEMAASAIRFGPGATQEVGMDMVNLGAKKVLVVSDATVSKLPAFQTATDALSRSGVAFETYTDVRVEPKDYSVKDAIAFGKKVNADAILAVGGGSVMDTAKLVNLYTEYPDAEFLDFVNAPLGKGRPVDKKLKPLVCVPTTAGTGSETTGTAIFDLVASNTKTGIAHRALKPTLGICDPLNTKTMPSAVVAASGLDVLCHALESYTAIPYHTRSPRPVNPLLRPAYQGANPISDVFSFTALEMVAKYLPRAVKSPDDEEAHEKMLLAATLAGVGFGNAGVHLCHGMSYPISGRNKSYRHAGYAVDHPLVPHGVSVAVTAPAVFRFTAASNPQRHLQCAKVFGANVDVPNAAEKAGEILSDALKAFLRDLGDQPAGLKALGYTRGDIPSLVEGTLPQRRVLVLAPGMAVEGSEKEREDLEALFEAALEY